MPLTALLKSTGERILITNYTNPKAQLHIDDIVCPFCQSPMFIVAGNIRIMHFRHRATCTTPYAYNPESIEHIVAKLKLAELARSKYGSSGAKVELEVVVPEAGRIADVLISYPNGWKTAYEIQLASTITEELNARTRAYEQAGIDVVWFIGKNADTRENRAWHYKYFGAVNTIDFRTENNELEMAV